MFERIKSSVGIGNSTEMLSSRERRNIFRNRVLAVLGIGALAIGSGIAINRLGVNPESIAEATQDSTASYSGVSGTQITQY